MTWYDLIWLDMTWYDLIWLDMTWYDLIWLDMTWYDLIIQYNTMAAPISSHVLTFLRAAFACTVIEGYDLIWLDMTWYDLIWLDMTWQYDTLLCCAVHFFFFFAFLPSLALYFSQIWPNWNLLWCHCVCWKCLHSSVHFCIVLSIAQHTSPTRFVTAHILPHFSWFRGDFPPSFTAPSLATISLGTYSKCMHFLSCSVRVCFADRHVGVPSPADEIKLVDVPEMSYFAQLDRGEVRVYVAVIHTLEYITTSRI
jgi:hypothetical protein